MAAARRRILRRAATRKGSAAIEFALLAPILFVLIMGIIEIGIMFLAQFVLQNAVDEAARLIRTGQAAGANMSETQFRQYVCDRVSSLMACDANLQIDVETPSALSVSAYASALKPDGTLDSNLDNYAIGDVCSVVLVRAFYTWNVATPLLTPFMVNMAGNKHLLSAAAAFRNEPYSTSVSGC
jgi:Flp pilus assembly protein TadG